MRRTHAVGRELRRGVTLWRSLLALAVWPVGNAGSLRAQGRESPTLADLVAQARQRNPDILAARALTDSARAEQQIARAVPNPQAAAIPGSPFQYTLTQSLDFGPQRLLRTRSAARGTEAAELDAVTVERRVTFAVRQAYYDLLLTRALRDLAAEERGIFRDLLTADSARLRAGDLAAREVTKTELELARADARLARTVADQHAAALALQLLLGVTGPDTTFPVAGELRYTRVSIPVDSLQSLAARERPELAAAERRVARSRALRSFARAALVPQPTLSLVYQPDESFATGLRLGSHYALGFGVAVPLFYWNGGEHGRADAGVRAAEVDQQRTAAHVRQEVVTQLDALRASRALAERYQGGLLEKARQALEAAQYAYRTGAASQLDLLEAIRTNDDVRADNYTAVHDYWVSAYALDLAVGRDVIP